jgi:hypothetical protein
MPEPGVQAPLPYCCRSVSRRAVVRFENPGEPVVKFIYFEKATKFGEISTVIRYYIGQIKGGDFAIFCGLLRIYEL